MVTNTNVTVMQRGALWASDAQYDAPIKPLVTDHAIGQGEDLAIAIEVATPVADDVISFIRKANIPVERLPILTPPGGPRDSAVTGSNSACALAVGIRDTGRRAIRGHPRAHLFLAGPMALALLLGHRWNRIAPTLVYEDLAPDYEHAFTVSA
jgi:hypothetical protein